MLVDLGPQGQSQGELELFETEAELSAAARKSATQLMLAVDRLNLRFGRGAVSVASAIPTRPPGPIGSTA
jgi:hypothetical protein